MLILGIETSCDESGVALYDVERGLLGQALFSQADLHARYGGVVPELASRDHIRRVVPLIQEVMLAAGRTVDDLGAIAYTQGPGLAGALLVGASIAHGLSYGLGVPVMGIHHLEGHLLSPLMGQPAPEFPFVALLVSGGHSQLMRVSAVGVYEMLGETLDDAAGEAFDKTAQMLGLGYPGGPAIARLAEQGRAGRIKLPRPMMFSNDLDMSFAGLKTAVLTQIQRHALDIEQRADIAAEFQSAVIDVLTAKSLAALKQTGLQRLVVAGGVGANLRLRARLSQAAHERGYRVFFPAPELCTDNGAMIAHAAALRITHRKDTAGNFAVKPRWSLTGDFGRR